jgi:hypothetical protein
MTIYIATTANVALLLYRIYRHVTHSRCLLCGRDWEPGEDLAENLAS